MAIFTFLVAPVVSAYHAPVVAKTVIPAATSYANTYKVIIFIPFRLIRQFEILDEKS